MKLQRISRELQDGRKNKILLMLYAENFCNVVFAYSINSLIERCYKHYRHRKSLDQSMQLVRHLRIKPQPTNSWKPGSVSSLACGITYCFFLFSCLTSFTYLLQSCSYIIWFCEALWVSVCEKTWYKFKFCCICMNRFRLKCPWGKARIFIRRNTGAAC